MRHGRCEARAQLLVGGKVAGRTEVDERLPAAVDLVLDLQGVASLTRLEQLLGQHLSDDDALQRLPRAPAGREHPAIGVEHDDVLAAFLDERLGPPARG